MTTPLRTAEDILNQPAVRRVWAAPTRREETMTKQLVAFSLTSLVACAAIPGSRTQPAPTEPVQTLIEARAGDARARPTEPNSPSDAARSSNEVQTLIEARAGDARARLAEATPTPVAQENPAGSVTQPVLPNKVQTLIEARASDARSRTKETTQVAAGNSDDQTPPRESRMFQYFVAIGLSDKMEQERESRRKLYQDQMMSLLDQIQTDPPTVPKEYLVELSDLTARMAEQIDQAYTIEEALRVYAAPFDRNYPGETIDEAIEQLSSPEGQKLTSTLNEALTALGEFQADREEVVVQKAMAEFTTAVKQLVERLRASKKR